MRKGLLALLFVYFTFFTPVAFGASEEIIAKAFKEYSLYIPSDPGANYIVLNIEGTNNEPILTTKRVGSSGTSYSKRLFDCKNKKTKYLGDGNSIDEMNKSKASPRMGDIFQESIAWYQWDHVCNK